MKTVAITSALTGAALAATIRRQDADIDSTVLNFALTLEHLENTFYSGALAKFSEADFTAAGAPANFYKNLQYIAYDEATHVKELTGALQAAKVTPVEPCEYEFGYTDAKSFLGLDTIVEGVGTSAYLGAAGLITSKDYLTVAGSILVSEALHTSLLRYSTGLISSANPNGTPLDPTSVYSIVAPFFKSCPSSNPALPFKAFPAVSGAPTTPVNQGQTITLKTTADVPAGSYLTFVSGLAVTSVQATGDKNGLSAAVPSDASGQSYVLITKSAASGGKLSDATVLAGPAIIEVNPAPVMGGASGPAPSYAPSPSTGGSGSSNGTAPAPASMPSGMTGGSGSGSSGSGSGSSSGSSGAAPAPAATNAGSRLAVGGASAIALFAGVMLL